MPAEARRTHAWTAPGGERYEARKEVSAWQAGEEIDFLRDGTAVSLCDQDCEEVTAALFELLSLAERLERAEALLAEIWRSVPAEHQGPAVERHAAVLNRIPDLLSRELPKGLA